MLRQWRRRGGREGGSERVREALGERREVREENVEEGGEGRPGQEKGTNEIQDEDKHHCEDDAISADALQNTLVHTAVGRSLYTDDEIGSHSVCAYAQMGRIM